MRKIKSREEIEKSQKRAKVIAGGVLIFLMVFSTAGFAFFNREDSSFSEDEQGGNSNYYFNGQYFVYRINGQEFYFTNNLELTQIIPVDINIAVGNYAGSNIYLAFDNDIIANEISQNLGRYAERIQMACYGSCEKDLPEKECDENLIIWKESEAGRVYQEENCIFIEGDLIAVDAFLYNVLGIN
jgi:hypothetical protein